MSIGPGFASGQPPREVGKALPETPKAEKPKKEKKGKKDPKNDPTSGVFEVDTREEQGSEYSLFDIAWGAGWDIEGAFEYVGLDTYDDYRTMLRQDGKARSLEAALTAPLMGAAWHIEPAEGDKGEAEFAQNYLSLAPLAGGMKTPFQDVIGQATSARTFRKAFFEKNYKVGTGPFEGKIVYDDISFRPGDTCRLWRDEQTGAFKGFRQRPVRKSQSQSDEEIREIVFHPPYCWVHINGQHRAPLDGMSDMEVPLWCYKTKVRILWLWTVFLTRQAEPRTVVKGDDTEKAALALSRLDGGGVVAVNKNTDVETIESSATGATMYQEFVAYLDSQMLAACLAGFLDLTSPTQATGSYALSADQSAFFEKVEQRVTKEMAESITKNIVGDLILINFGPDAAFPEFVFETNNDTGMTDMLTLLQTRTADLPFEFFEQLALKVSTVLDLDEEVVREALEKAGDVAEKKVQMGLDMQQTQIDGAKNPEMAQVGKKAVSNLANATGRVAAAKGLIQAKVGAGGGTAPQGSNRQQAKSAGSAGAKATAPKRPAPPKRPGV